jgi:hypothetical protein
VLQKVVPITATDGDFVVLDKDPIAFDVRNFGFIDDK